MRRQALIVPTLLFALLVAGCGGSSNTTTPGPSATTSAQPGSGASGSDAATDCPTENTRSFAKTRFAADIGGSLFLMNRYVLQPYRGGKFTKGTGGRTAALIKAGIATAATAKLLKNAKENAKASPSLCKAVSGPLTQLSNGLDGVVDGLKSGSLPESAISGVGGLLGSVTSKAAEAGIPIKEQEVPLR